MTDPFARQKLLLSVASACESDPKFLQQVIEHAMSGVQVAYKEASKRAVDMEALAYNSLSGGKPPSKEFVSPRVEEHKTQLRFTYEAWKEIVEKL